MRDLDEVVEEAATMVVGMHPTDQAAALAAGCEAVDENLHEQQPELTDEEIRGVCVQLAHRVKRRLGAFEALGVDGDAFH